MSLDTELASVEPSKEVGPGNLVSSQESENFGVNKYSGDHTKQNNDQLVNMVSDKTFLVIEERGTKEPPLKTDEPPLEVETVCASVTKQKENREKRACVFVERLQRLKTRVSLLDTSRLGRLGASGTLLDEDPGDERSSPNDVVTPRFIQIDMGSETNIENPAVKTPQRVPEISNGSSSEISNSKLVANVTAEVEMLNSMKSKQTKKPKVSVRVGLIAKSKLGTKGKPKHGSKNSNKKK